MASLYLPDIFRNVTNFTLAFGTDLLTAATVPTATSPGYTSATMVHGDDVNMATGTEGIVDVAENVTAASAVPASLKTTRLVVQSFLTPIVVTIGLLGNLLNILVLFQVPARKAVMGAVSVLVLLYADAVPAFTARLQSIAEPSMRTSTNVYLLVLSLADSVYLMMNIPLSLLSCSKPGMSLAVYKFNPYGRFISNFSGNVAVWVTVVFTVERYLAVCHPIHGKVWCTVHRAKLASLAATLLVFINTLPTLFELEVVIEEAAAAATTTTTDAFAAGNTNRSYVISGGDVGEVGVDRGGDYSAPATSVYGDSPPGLATSTSQLGAWSDGYVAKVFFSNSSSVDFSEMLTAVFTTPSLAEDPAESSVIGVGGSGDVGALGKQQEGQSLDLSGKENSGQGSQSAGVPRCVETSLARQPSYMIGYSWWYVTVFAFVPMFFLAIFNTVLIRALFVAGRKRQQLALISTSAPPTNGTAGGKNSTSRFSTFLKPTNRLSKKEQKIARKEMKKLSSACRDVHSGVMSDGLSTSQQSHGSFNDTSSHTSIAATLTHKRQTRRISREQNKVTLLLVTIVMIFFLCQLPWTALYLYKVLGPEPSRAGITRLKIAGNVCNLLALVNASVNFYLYSCFSKRFRRTLAKLVLCWRRKRNMSPTTV